MGYVEYWTEFQRCHSLIKYVILTTEKFLGCFLMDKWEYVLYNVFNKTRFGDIYVFRRTIKAT